MPCLHMPPAVKEKEAHSAIAGSKKNSRFVRRQLCGIRSEREARSIVHSRSRLLFFLLPSQEAFDQPACLFSLRHVDFPMEIPEFRI